MKNAHDFEPSDVAGDVHDRDDKIVKIPAMEAPALPPEEPTYGTDSGAGAPLKDFRDLAVLDAYVTDSLRNNSNVNTKELIGKGFHENRRARRLLEAVTTPTPAHVVNLGCCYAYFRDFGRAKEKFKAAKKQPSKDDDQEALEAAETNLEVLKDLRKRYAPK